MKKWLYKLLLGLGIPFLFMVIAKPFSYKAQDIFLAFVFVFIFCVALAFLLSKLEYLFYVYESKKLNRIKRYFNGKTINENAITLSLDGIEVTCTLTRTSATNNFSKFKFFLPKKLVRNKVIKKFDFIVPTKIENTDFFQIHASHGLFLNKLKEDLRKKITLIRIINKPYKNVSIKKLEQKAF